LEYSILGQGGEREVVREGRQGDGSGPQISLRGEFQLETEGPTIILLTDPSASWPSLALKGRLVRASVAAGTLWPVATEDHAFSSLRSALARLQGRAVVAAAWRAGRPAPVAA
jgi:hypothetical protein